MDIVRFEPPEEKQNIIKVMGVGGGGSNAVTHMFSEGITGVDFVLCNTDDQALQLTAFRAVRRSRQHQRPAESPRRGAIRGRRAAAPRLRRSRDRRLLPRPGEAGLQGVRRRRE